MFGLQKKLSPISDQVGNIFHRTASYLLPFHSVSELSAARDKALEINLQNMSGIKQKV